MSSLSASIMSIASADNGPKPMPKDESQQTSDKSKHPVDAKLNKLTDEVLPTAPYILSGHGSMNADYVRVHYPQNAINWKKHSLFSRGEAELQYLTFLKDRPGDDQIGLFRAKGGWDDGKGRIAAPDEPYSRTSSDGTPKTGQVPKKKITLAEYKNKDRSKVAAPVAKPTGPVVKEAVKSDDKTSSHAASVKDLKKTQQAEHHGQKRSADAMTGTKDPQAVAQPPSSPPTKKARPNPELSTAAAKIQQKAPPLESKAEIDLKEVQVTAHKGPPGEVKATPNIMANTSVKAPAVLDKPQPEKPVKPVKPTLPPMLSPLSSAVEEAIAKMTPVTGSIKPGTTNSKGSVSTPSLTSSKADAPSASAINKATKASSAGKAAVSAKTSKSTISTKGPQEQKQGTPNIIQSVKESAPKAVATPKVAQNALPNNNDAASTPTPKTSPPNAPKRMRLRVILKIKKKANKKKLRDYLNLKPTPGRNSLFPGRAIEHEQHPTDSTSQIKSSKNGLKEDLKKDLKKGDIKALRPEIPKTGEKRARSHIDEDEHEPSAKRKAPSRLPPTQKPSTPKPSHTSSPSLSHLGSAQKPPTSTPNAQASGTAMLRGGSAQGSVNTPHQSSVTGTPAAPETGRRRSSYTSPDKPKSEDLRPEAAHFQTTARTLKHEADVFLRKDEMNEDDCKQGIVLGTEAVLCFMMAFILLDTPRSYSARTSWLSILPFFSNVQTVARSKAAEGLSDLKELQGCLSQIEAVIRDQVAYADMQLLDKNPLEHELGNPAADPEKTKEQHKAAEYHKYYAAYHKMFMTAQRAWRVGWLLLDTDKIRTHYPATWAQRDEHRAAYGKGRDAIVKGEFTRKYNLPLNNMTSGPEAVNFGVNFLAEWSKKAGIERQPKLVL